MKTQPQLTTIDSSELSRVLGGASLAGKAVEWGRAAWNAGAVAWNVLNPNHVPVKPIPTPPRIERPASPRTGTTAGSKAAE